MDLAAACLKESEEAVDRTYIVTFYNSVTEGYGELCVVGSSLKAAAKRADFLLQLTESGQGMGTEQGQTLFPVSIRLYKGVDHDTI